MLSCLFVSIFMQTDRAGLPGTPNIDHALIGAAAPAELLSALPDMVKGMDKCAKLLRAPLPLDR